MGAEDEKLLHEQALLASADLTEDDRRRIKRRASNRCAPCRTLRSHEAHVSTLLVSNPFCDDMALQHLHFVSWLCTLIRAEGQLHNTLP